MRHLLAFTATASVTLLTPLSAQLITFSSGATNLQDYTGGGTLELRAQFSGASAAALHYGTITGTAAANKTGTGSIILYGANSYTGGTTISAGALELAGGNASGVGTIQGKIKIDIGNTLRTTQTNALGWLAPHKVDRIELWSGSSFHNTASGDQGWGVIYDFIQPDAVVSSNNGHLAAANNTASSASYLTFGGYAGASAITTNSGGSRFYGRIDLRRDDGYDYVALTPGPAGVIEMHAALTSAVTPGTGMAKTGAGVLELRAINTYTGATTVNDGTLKLINELHSPNSGVGTIRGALVLNNGAVQLQNANVLGYLDGQKVDSVTINGGSLVNTSGGPQGWGIAYSLNGGSLSSNGGVASASAGSLFSFGKNTTITVANNTQPRIAGRIDLRDDVNPNTDFTIGTGAVLNVTAAVTGAGGVNKLGPGTLTLAGPVTYTGATSVSAGTLEVQAGTLSGVISGAGTINKTGSGGLTFAADNTFTGTLNLNAGVLGISSAANLGSSTLAFNGGSLETFTSFTINRPATLTADSRLYPLVGTTLTWNGSFSGSGGLIKSGAGDLILGGPSSHTGNTLATLGTLKLGYADGAGVGTVRRHLSANNATIDATVVNALGYAAGAKVDSVELINGVFKNSTQGDQGWGVAYTLNNSVLSSNAGVSSGTAASKFSFGAGTSVAVVGTSSTIEGRIDLRDAATFTVNSGGLLYVTAALTSSAGPTGFTKTGAGTMELVGFDTYAGTVNVNGGTLKVARAPGTTYNLAGTAALTPSTLEINGDGVVGSPVFNLGNYGEIGIGNSATAGSGTFNLNSTSSSLVFAGSGSAGSATLNAKGAINFFDNSNAPGATINLNNGSVKLWFAKPSLSIGALSGSGTVDLDSTALTVGALGTSTSFSGLIRGPFGGSLKKVGDGTFNLTGPNAYTGGTTVSAGTLLANNTTGSAVGAGAVSVLSGATLGGGGFIGGATTLAGGAHLAPGNSPGTLTFTNGLALSAGSLLHFELGTASDLLRISGGTLTGPGAGTITVNLLDSGGFTAGTYTLIDATGAALTSIGATVFELGTLIAGYDFSFVQNGDLFQLTATSAIPEPATYAALFGLGSLVVACRRKRHRP